MARADRILAYTCVKSEGSILPYDLLARVAAADRTLDGVKAEDYHLGPNERFGEVVSRSWSRLTGAWKSLREAVDKQPEGDPAIRVTRERFLLPLFQELGYGRLQTTNALEVDGKNFPISHAWQQTPIHLLGWGVDLDKRQRGVAGAAQSSPHGLVQDLLNRSDAHLWGLLANGRQLRILRDHQSLTRQAYVEFDLQAMFDGELYGEFLLLWLVCHESRVEADKPENCWLEKWFLTSRQQGVQAHAKLREGVEATICALGSGLIQHPKNTALREALQSGALTPLDLYRQILRVVYRLLFVLVAEDRGALHPPATPDLVRRRYQRFYSLRRLRDLAAARRGGPHADLWQQLKLVQTLLAGGDAAVGLPALGSYLWSQEAAPWPMASECSNHHLLGAVTHLTTVATDNRRGRLPVNFRTLGAEELGSVYEGLLELHPVVHAETGKFELEGRQGNERKTTGSYYTPSSLVDCLLDSALDPVLDEAWKKPNREAALLELKVVDPACGSGHFLVAAARRIAKRLAAARSGDDEPSPEAMQHALRDVVGRCIYGVDLNAMAVELCKVSLWVEALEPGRPLSFLDAHIQCGNSLLGATPELLDRRDEQGRLVGIPDEAFVALEGDDTKVTADLRKRNKAQRGGDLLFSSVGEQIDFGALRTQMRAVLNDGDATLLDVRAKATHYREYLESQAYLRGRAVSDAWCSAFMWTKVPNAPALTNAEFQAIQDGRRIPEAIHGEIARLSEHYRFFHVHLAFPEVLERGGFDVVLGNPPWETMSPDAKEFFAAYDPQIRFQDKDGQAATIARLSQEPNIAAAWEANRRDLFATVHFIKQSGRFRMFAEGNLGKGDFNVYRMFVEHALTATRPGGRAAQFVPEGLYNGANCAAIRADLFEKCKLERLFGFENTREVWFKDVHTAMKFAMYAATPGGATEAFEAAFCIRSEQQLAHVAHGAAFQVPVAMVREFSPDALAVMEFSDQRDVVIASKMYSRWPKFGDSEAGPPRRVYMREFDMGTDRECFGESAAGLPLYEGRMVDQFDHRAKGYRSGRGRAAVWEDLPFGHAAKSIQPQWRVALGDVPDKVLPRMNRYRAGFCDVASPTNERSLCAALLPSNVVSGDKVPTIVFEDGSDWTLLLWLAVANSYAMDFVARKKISLKMSYTVLDSLPFPRLNRDSAVAQCLVPLALRLSCCGPEMTEFWNAMAADGWCEAVPADGLPPGIEDEDERLRIRAEIDAIVARDVFGLTASEMEYVLATFPIVREREERAYGEFRTRRLIFEAFERTGGPRHG